MDKLGEAIEDLRKKQGFKRKYAFAKEIGIGESYYSKISTDKQDPSFETLEDIAAALKLPLSVIIVHAEALKAGKDDQAILEDIKKFFSE
jgi:transcriptional regulator with XRE-family HTH domain